MVYTWRGSGATEGLFGGLVVSPDSCCKMERSQQDQGGVQRPQSLNPNVLLMPGCEGHQEHKLNEGFIVASVYNNPPLRHHPPDTLAHTHTHMRAHFVSVPLSNQFATLHPSARLLKFA